MNPAQRHNTYSSNTGMSLRTVTESDQGHQVLSGGMLPHSNTGCAWLRGRAADIRCCVRTASYWPCDTAVSAHLQACAHMPALQCTCVGTTCDALTACVKEVPARLQRLSVPS